MSIRSAVEKTIQDIKIGAIEPAVTYEAHTSGRPDMIATRVIIGEHSFISDLNSCLGGSELAPCPAEYFLGAVAACIKMSCTINAALMGITPETIEVVVSGFSDRRGNLGLDDAVPVGFQNIEYRVKIITGKADEKTEQLVEKVERESHLINTLRKSIDVKGQFEITNR